MTNESRPDDLQDFNSRIEQALTNAESIAVHGRINEVRGSLLRVSNIRCAIGEVCELSTGPGAIVGYAEAVGFSGNWTFLSPLGQVSRLSPDVQVRGLGRAHNVQVGTALLGRVLNGFGQPIDNQGALQTQEMTRVDRLPADPIHRKPITRTFDTGYTVIDSLLTCGYGQRMGILAPPGVGKSSLIAQLAKSNTSDVNVIALVGERGREVGDFLRQVMSAKTRERTVIVAATSDRSAMERVRAAQIATAIAEHFRDQGKDALLLVDSLTRLARAQREIGLGVGEPATRRGFPPSVFVLLPRLLERAGNGTVGSITAFYTVLTEGDEQDDPIAEEVKAILDGHIVLSPELAAAGQFPAIDPLKSNSRLASELLNDKQRAIVSHARALLARYEEVRLLLQIGEYKSGTDPLTDTAIACQPALQELFRQPDQLHQPGGVTIALEKVAACLSAHAHESHGESKTQ